MLYHFLFNIWNNQLKKKQKMDDVYWSSEFKKSQKVVLDKENHRIKIKHLKEQEK